MAIHNLALYYRRPEAVALQGAKENSFTSLEGKLLRCKIKLQEHLSHTEQHVQVTMDSGSACLLPRVTTAGGRTAGRATFAHASNAFLSPLDTQKKKPVEDLGHLSQPGIGDHGRKAGGVREYSRQSAEVHTLPCHQLS